MNDEFVAKELVSVARELTAARNPWDERRQAVETLQQLAEDVGALWFSEDSYTFKEPPEYTRKINTAMGKLTRAVTKADSDVRKAIKEVDS